MRFSSSIIALLAAVSQASPFIERAEGCTDLATPISSIKACKSYTAFCTSVAPQSSVTSTVTITKTTKVTVKATGATTVTTSATTVTGEASTVTEDRSTITAPATTVYETAYATCTQAPGTTNANAKREGAAQPSSACLAKVQSKYDSSIVSSACACAVPAPTTKVTSTSIFTTTVTKYTKTVIVRPTSTVHPLTTVTPAPETVTPTSTATTTQTSTISTNGVTLASPTNIISSPGYYDDPYFYVDVPFNISLLGFSSSSVVVSVNGWLALSHDVGSMYRNVELPSYNGEFPRSAFALYWTDLAVIYGTGAQSLSYEVAGTAPNRTFSVEWNAVLHRNNSAPAHFKGTWYEAREDYALFSYYSLPTAPPLYNTVGLQSLNGAADWAYNDQYNPVRAPYEVAWTGGVPFVRQNVTLCSAA